ncbi:protease synthase and sporulation protein PAI 2 [Sporosarcina sp. NCCP-2716]|uniref:FMN-binding negative transcriptional regulator n=1 Tax=Sporosarcina sp. NCCP-2716 TaxID=2943679 RepID=UPI002042541A|nr:FMN-binding negative transcriptional regulator [Sporosarcina sp. NCCP-2716]GKV70197.1 protease synthase and sporulation protein PAI 2 [Sporosarcina sp. NCCP-2716]
MYIPKYFNVDDTEEVWKFVEQHAFGTVVTTVDGKPVATHVPLQVHREGEKVSITGHLAYGNRQWRTLESTDSVLVLFQGPHAYVSSSWYEKENVPTWNYQAVHVYGKARLLSEDELKRDLAGLLHKYEAHRESPVLWETLSPELVAKELKGIVGFTIHVTDVQAAYKLSQNRNERDYKAIIDKLEEEADDHSHQVAHVMKQRTEDMV